MGKKRRRYRGDVRVIQADSSGLLRVTVPRNLAEALGWERGTPVEWRVTGKGKAEVREVVGNAEHKQ